MASEFATFIMSETTVSQLKALPDNLKWKFFEAVTDYGLYGIEAEFEGLENVIWMGIRDLIFHSKRKDERWHETKRENGRKGGAPVGNNNASKQPKTTETTENNLNNLKQPTESETTNNLNLNLNLNLNDNLNDNLNLKKEEEPFSLKLNPSSENTSQRIEKLKENYNTLKIGPPFKKSVINMSPIELRDLMRIMAIYSDDVAIKAMENYQAVKPPEYDRKGCEYQSFISFMTKGIEKYCDEAHPFERFKQVINHSTGPPQGLPPGRNSIPKELEI